MQEEISLIDLFNIIKKHILIIITMTVLGLLASFFLTSTFITPQYASNTQLLVNHSATESTIQQSEINANIQLINTYEDIIKNSIILDEVRENLTLSSTIEEMREKITVQTDQNSQVFSIRVENENPYLAAEVANETANVFSNNIDDIMNVDNVSIISEAIPEDSPFSPNVMLNTLVGAMIGLIVGITISILKGLLDTTVKDESFIVNEIGWSSLGRISIIDKTDMKKTANGNVKDTVDTEVPSRRSRK